MARLIIVSGASGAGKSFVLQELGNINSLKAEPLRKLTTRGSRNESEIKANEKGTLDLVLNCSRSEINNLCSPYVYHYCGHHYGIKKTDIDEAIAKGLSPVVIVAKCSTVKTIKKDYPNALVLYVQNVLSGEDLKGVLLKGSDPLEVEERMERQKESFEDYVSHIEEKLFDYVLINNFSDQFKSQINYVFDNELDTHDSNYIFVIMSFDSKYDEIYEAFSLAGEMYKNQNQNIKIDRADKQKDSGFTITERIEKLINKAGLVICDVSELSPNVYFEFGYAKSKNKNIIITAKKGTKLPFDTNHYEHIFYETSLELQKKIIKKLGYYYKINQ